MPPSVPTSSPEPLTLEQLKEQFSHWRSTRTKRGKIPDDLLETIGRLIQQQTYSDRYIAAELGLNYQQLKLRLNRNLKKSEPSLSKLEFIDLPLSPTTFTPSQPPSLESIFYPCTVAIELTRSDGTALKASGCQSALKNDPQSASKIDPPFGLFFY